MTSKRVKAWAVVDECGGLIEDMEGRVTSYLKEKIAHRAAQSSEGERVVPVTIVWEEK